MSSDASGEVPLCPNCHRPRAVRNAPRCTYCGLVFPTAPPPAPSPATGATATAGTPAPAGDATAPGTGPDATLASGGAGDTTRAQSGGGDATHPATPPRPVKPVYITRVPNLYADSPPPRESVLPSWLQGTSGMLMAFFVFLAILFVGVFWVIKRHTPDADSWQPGQGDLASEMQQSQQAADEMRARQAGIPYAGQGQRPGAQGLHPALAPLVRALEEYAKERDRFPSTLSPDARELVRYVDKKTALQGLRGGAFRYSLQTSPDGRSETYTLSANLPDRAGTPVEWRETWTYRYVMQAPTAEDVSRGLPTPPPPSPTTESGTYGGEGSSGSGTGFNP